MEKKVKVRSEKYEVDGKKYDRVTSVLSFFEDPHLVKWRAKVGNKVASQKMQAAAKIGSKVDEKLAASWDAKEYKKADKEEVNYATQAWLAWRNDFRPKEMIWHPSPLFSDELKLAGTPDFIWHRHEGMTVLGDLKVTSRIRQKNFFQLGGYALLAPFTIHQLAILRLDPETGLYEWITNEHLLMTVEECRDAFRACLAHYRHYQYISNALKIDGGEEDDGTDSSSGSTERAFGSGHAMDLAEVRGDRTGGHRKE